jgi:Raf kinase inhibitor-like YbhB/YbcL family protein
MRASFVLALVVAVAACSGCGDGGEAAHGPSLPAAKGAMALTSPAFAPGAAIPKAYTCDGADRSPPLRWSRVPAGARELALVVEDPDAHRFLHWTLLAVAPAVHRLAAGQVPPGTVQTANGFGDHGYGGPCPPKGDDAHRYVFTIYALDAPSGLTADASPSAVATVLRAHALARGTLTASYARAS